MPRLCLAQLGITLAPSVFHPTEGAVVSTTRLFTNAAGVPVAANTNIMTAGPRGPPPLQDVWLIEIA